MSKDNKKTREATPITLLTSTPAEVLARLSDDHRNRGIAAGLGGAAGAVIGSIVGGPIGAGALASAGAGLGVLVDHRWRNPSWPPRLPSMAPLTTH